MGYVIYYVNFQRSNVKLALEHHVMQYEIYDPSDCNTSFCFWLGADALDSSDC